MYIKITPVSCKKKTTSFAVDDTGDYTYEVLGHAKETSVKEGVCWPTSKSTSSASASNSQE